MYKRVCVCECVCIERGGGGVKRGGGGVLREGGGGVLRERVCTWSMEQGRVLSERVGVCIER